MTTQTASTHTSLTVLRRLLDLHGDLIPEAGSALTADEYGIRIVLFGATPDSEVHAAVHALALRMDLGRIDAHGWQRIGNLEQRVTAASGRWGDDGEDAAAVDVAVRGMEERPADPRPVPALLPIVPLGPPAVLDPETTVEMAAPAPADEAVTT